jgi:hypothetical protein
MTIQRISRGNRCRCPRLLHFLYWLCNLKRHTVISQKDHPKPKSHIEDPVTIVNRVYVLEEDAQEM